MKAKKTSTGMPPTHPDVIGFYETQKKNIQTIHTLLYLKFDKL